MMWTKEPHTHLVRSAVDVVVDAPAQNLKRLLVEEEPRPARVEDLLWLTVVGVGLSKKSHDNDDETIRHTRRGRWAGEKTQCPPHTPTYTQTKNRQRHRVPTFSCGGRKGRPRKMGLVPCAVASSISSDSKYLRRFSTMRKRSSPCRKCVGCGVVGWLGNGGGLCGVGPVNTNTTNMYDHLTPNQRIIFLFPKRTPETK